MKFAKQLAEEAVPEWQDKYVNYKAGKKLIKAVAKATRNVPSQRPARTPGSSLRDAPVRNLFKNRRQNTGLSSVQPIPQHTRSHSDSNARSRNASADVDATPKAIPIHERSPLQSKQPGNASRAQPDRMTSYGSIIGSPPHNVVTSSRSHQAPSLELPAPAIESKEEEEDSPISPSTTVVQSRDSDPLKQPLSAQTSNESASSQPPRIPPTQLAHTGNAYKVGTPTDQPLGSGALPESRFRSLFLNRTNSSPTGPFIRRVFSTADGSIPQRPRDDHDVALEAYKELDYRKGCFHLYLDKELQKVEEFYRSKEDAARGRLQVLREQLHIMRQYRLEEIAGAAHKRKLGEVEQPAGGDDTAAGTNLDGDGADISDARRLSAHYVRSRPLSKSIDLVGDALDRVRNGHIGKSSKAMGKLGSPEMTRQGTWQPDNAHRDYAKRRSTEVPYRAAKRKMKLALAEYYRGLDLLKGYSATNRTAFRKIVKKYNKCVAEPTDFFEKNVSKAHFVTSEEVEHLMSTVEDLYARYFESGNRKVAVSKLRTKHPRAGDYTGPIARSCALLGAGAVLAIDGLVHGAEELFNRDSTVRVETSYALQIYAGYFLALFLAFLFTSCCVAFDKYKVNYQFIFELDKRSALNWHQVLELPSWLFFLLGGIMFMHFDLEIGKESFYTWWPLVLIVVAVVFLFMPAPVWYPRARWWFAVTLWRLILSGLYDVEFRDFFMGDMFCSLTYAMGNIELFFCLYARNWNGPQQCNSTHSRLLGFFSTLPGIWRAFQCIRRYYDEKVVFPHLVNCGKYMFTILMYVSLSVYRIDKTSGPLAFFITMSTINSIYCSIWDIFMDWSLIDVVNKPTRLRKVLVYKKHIWWYYVALVLDPILRFNWIFYAIYTTDVQHSTVCAFLVGLSEVWRRGIWTLFRVENEQVNNIIKKQASKDLPLPYALPGAEPSDTQRQMSGDAQVDGAAANRSSRESSLLENQSPVVSVLHRVGTIMRAAHARDYERKKRPDEDLAEEDSEDDDDNEGEQDDSDE